MKRKLNICITLFIGFATILAAIFGVITRNSYIDNLSQKEYQKLDEKELTVNIDFSDFNEEFMDPKVFNLEDLIEVSEVIVRVSAREECESVYYCSNTLTKVKVEEVIKGILSNDYIYVLEPVYFYEEGQYISSRSGYKWMQDGNEYLLFLREYPSDNICDDENIYLYSTLKYSKYNVACADDLYSDSYGHALYNQIREGLGLVIE